MAASRCTVNSMQILARTQLRTLTSIRAAETGLKWGLS